MEKLFIYSKSLVKLTVIMFCMALLITLNPAHGQCNLPVFPAPADILANVPEAAGYNLLYTLPIPTDNQVWTDQAQVPYSVNNSAALASSAYTRVGYYLKLESVFLGVQWVWVSFDKFSNDVALIGIPTGSTFWQQQVTNMNVLNYSGINKTAITGNIEFWPNCYLSNNAAAVPGASNDVFDFGDSATSDPTCGYGSFQVHDFNALSTLLAYNGWASSTGTADDLGVDNYPFGQPDWTFANNANLYDVKELFVFINTTGAAPTCNNASISLNAAGNASITAAMVTNAVPGNCGVQSISLSKSSFSCADLGNNTITVTTTDINNNTTTCSSVVTVTDTLRPVITATGTTLTLGSNPSAAAINAALGTATATDNCGTPTLTVSNNAVIVNGCFKSQTRTWNASDQSGNQAIPVSRTVTWRADNTPPVITATGTTLTLGCNPSRATINAALGTATVVENCTIAIMIDLTGPVIANGCSRSQTRTWYAIDLNLNVATPVSRTVTWTGDLIPPNIRATGNNLSLHCNPTTAEIEAALGTATATDNCSSPVLMFITGNVGGNSGIYTQTRTWRAQDACGNISTVSRTAHWPKHCNHEGHENDRIVPADQLIVSVLNNPSSNYFSLNIQGKNSGPVSIRVSDWYGRPVYVNDRVSAKSALRLGDEWPAGVYFAEIAQGEERRVVKLVKVE